MRRQILPFALVLAVATGFVLAQLGFLVSPPAASDAAVALASANTAAISRFYAAINTAVATGDVTPFDALLAADYVEHAALPGQSNDRQGLERYLRVLHRASPAMAMTGYDFVAQGDRVAAHVQIDGANRATSGSRSPIDGRAWGTLDFFRLRAGRIVEHWGDELGLAVAEPLLTVGVPVALPTTKWVELGRLTYQPGGADQRWTSGPTVLFVQTGSLIVAENPVSPEATYVAAAGEERVIAEGETVALAVGDALVLASGSFFETRNDGRSPATALVFWSGDPEFPRHVSAAKPETIATPNTASPGSTYAAVAGGMTANLPGEQASVTIERVALTPGAAVASHLVQNAQFIAVEAGRLVLSVEGGQANLRSGPQDATRMVTGGTSAAGTGLALESGTTAGFSPGGNTTLLALVVTIGPDFDAS